MNLDVIIEELSFLFRTDRFPSYKKEFDELCRLARIGEKIENPQEEIKQAPVTHTVSFAEILPVNSSIL